MIIIPLSMGGAGTATNPTVCSGSITTINLTGNTGTIQWQQSANGITGWANVTGGSGDTTATYTTPNLTSTTYYRAQVTSRICASDYSTTASVTVTPLSAGGTATTTDPIVCLGNSTTITLAGYSGAIQWQQSANGTSGWATVMGGAVEQLLHTRHQALHQQYSTGRR